MPRWMMFTPFAMRPYLSADESGGTGGGGESSDANAGGQQGGKEETPTTVISFPDEKSFMARVKRDAKMVNEARAQELGFDSVAAMENALKTAKEQGDKEKTDLEREKEARLKAEADRDADRAKAHDRMVRAEVKSIAADLNIVDGDAAYALMDRKNVSVDDDDNVSGVKEALEALLTSKPYLKKPDGLPGRNSGDGFSGGGNPPKDEVKPGLPRLRNAYANPKRS